MKPVEINIAFRKFKPDNVVFVIAFDEENNRPSGMVASWNMICSLEPPLFAVAIGKDRHTLKLVRETKEFVIAVPNKGLEEAVRVFGETHGNEVNKFEATKLKTAKAKFLKAPLLADATANFECKIVQEAETGDHIIVVGKILVQYANEDKRVLLNLGKKEGKRVFEEF